MVETVDNVRRQKVLSEKSMKREHSPAGYQRRHEMNDYAPTGEVLGVRRRKIAEESLPITSNGKWATRRQDGGMDRSTDDRHATKRVRREGSKPVEGSLIRGEVRVR